ncbi:FecR family protein [uncultured Chitinophaga sp.]|jgi:Fe2+-dicitrate sensor, membrane component|uniref:FecR family protein n=1 Tax=uncultured Chitinophaga sp. TaxID=339340 RepID=UPI00262C54C7|nr:FecR family protein [uncultured Chitinophaga sp.]
MDPVNEHLEIADLIAKHFNGRQTAHEAAELEAWINAAADHQRLWEQLNDDAKLREQMLAMPDTGSTGDAWRRLQPRLVAERPRPHIAYRVFLYAAAIAGMLLGAGGLVYLMLHRPDNAAPAAVAEVNAPAATPDVHSRSKARLILGNGKVIALKNEEEQTFTEEDGTRITTSGTLLSYSPGSAAAAPVYNTLEIPRGGEYKVMLPDSSVVWMNAASSLRFLTRFNGNRREVDLSGEAYFEVAENKSKPFIVNINNISITVTGTQFNIKGYPDEPYINTTLVEGGVELRTTVHPGAKPVLLRPGYQAVWADSRMTVKEAYLEEALAWKNGLFVFRSEPVGSIMRKLSRWYDVEVKYPDTSLSNIRFTGTIRKYASIQQVLKMLALTQKVTFRMDDKRVTVLKADNQ